MRLGDFSTSVEELDEDDTFGYFGAELRVNPTFVDADLADFLEAGRSIDVNNEAAAMLFLKDFLRRVVHPEDFDEFWDLASKHRQTLRQRLQTIYSIIEAVADRPTKSSTDSSDGQQPVEPKSVDDSFSRVIARLEGRPDLKLVAYEAQAARAAG